MTTRACDFSSFRRPLRPSNNTSGNNSPSSTTGRSDTVPQSFPNTTVENKSSTPPSSGTMNSNARKLMASHSVGPTARPGNYDYLSGSIPRFHGVSSPSMSSFSPNPTTTFSNQNLEQISSYDRRPSNVINHSTIDRSTLPYDRKQTTPEQPERSNLSRQGEGSSGSGSGLIFLDGGKRGVMSADSQHSLNGSLSGHRMDRSLAHRQHSAVHSMKDSLEYDGGYDTHPRQQRNDVMQQYNSAQRYHAGQYQPEHSSYMDAGQQGSYGGNNHDEVLVNYNNVGGVMIPGPYGNNIMSSRHHNVIRGSPHNVSSGESGIAGCDFNTLGARSYDTYAGGAVDSSAGYVAAVPSTYGRYASVGGRLASNSSAVMHAVSQPDNQTGIYDPQHQHSQQQYATGSQGSNGGSNRSSNTAESSLTARGECNQQTLLIPSGSAIRLNTSADESVTVYDHSHPFSFSSYQQQQQQQQSSSIPKITTRVPSRRSQNKGFNLFKKGRKRDKHADDIYTKNNLYGSSGKKTSQVTLGSTGGPTTGLNFSAKYSSPMKRPFCPRWQCIALAVAIGILFLLCIGLIIYFYVWPSILQPLVESSKPVDGKWGEWTPWFQCSATCGQGNQHRQRVCNSPSPEDGGRDCMGPMNEMRNCSAPIECPDCTRVCKVGTLSSDCRQCTCEGHSITGRISDENGDPLPGVKVYKNNGAALLLSGTDKNGEFHFEGVCSNGENELKLVKEMYRVSIVTPAQQQSDKKEGYVSYAMTKLHLPHFIFSPESQERLVGQKVVLCCEAQSEQPPSKYVWYKDNTRLDPAVYKYSLQQTSLALPNLADWENGDYTCEVHNEAGVVKSKPASLIVYRNWTDLCNPSPADKFISLPDGCSQSTFNTGTCENDVQVSTTESTSDAVTGNSHPQCISSDQYPSNENDNTCSIKEDAPRYCCKPMKTEEISVSCTLKEIGQPYNMALKRIISCGCVLC